MRFRMREGFGSHRDRTGKKISAGDIVRVKHPADLGGAIDKFEALDPAPEEARPRTGLVAVPGHGRRWNVEDPNGRRVNDVPLTKEEADDLVSEYTTPGVALNPTGESSNEWKIAPNRETPELYDVVNPITGAVKNETPLSEAEAEEMVKALGLAIEDGQG